MVCTILWLFFFSFYLFFWCGVCVCVKKRNHCSCFLCCLSFDSFIFFYAIITIKRYYYKFIYDKYSLNLFRLEMEDTNADISKLHRHNHYYFFCWLHPVENIYFWNLSEATTITMMHMNKEMPISIIFSFIFSILHGPSTKLQQIDIKILW